MDIEQCSCCLSRNQSFAYRPQNYNTRTKNDAVAYVVYDKLEQ